MITSQEIQKDIVTDEKILGIFRTIHSKIIRMDIDIKNFSDYDNVIKDKQLLEKFYKYMHQIYTEIHSELSSFKKSRPQPGQEQTYIQIVKSLEDFEKKITRYSEYMKDMGKAFKDPIDKNKFEKDYEILNIIYNDIRKDEDIAEKYMKILQQNMK
jgi:hypothetical protein